MFNQEEQEGHNFMSSKVGGEARRAMDIIDRTQHSQGQDLRASNKGIIQFSYSYLPYL